MALPTWSALLALVLVSQAAAARLSAIRSDSVRANPIRKVVKMLQDMEKKVIEEGKEAEELYKKYECYCSSGGKDLADSISAAEDKIPAVESKIEASEKEKAKLDEAVEKAQADRAAAQTSQADATSTREKEAAVFAEAKGDFEKNIAAIKKAVAALRAGSFSGFLQTGAAATLRQIFSTHGQLLDDAGMDVPDLTAFLSGAQKQDAEYAPQSGEIIGVLEQIGDSMAQDLNETVDTEEKALQAFKTIMAAKAKEINLLTEEIERKMARSADLGVSIATMKNDLSATQAGLEDDKKFAEDLKADCATRSSERDENKKTRKEELAALADTIKLLNDDDALELFKSTLPSAAMSFVQLEGSGRAKAHALQILSTASNGRHGGMQRLDFIGLALKGNTVGFDKVIKMIDNMVEIIKDEQTGDENKKTYCLQEIDVTEDKLKKLNWTSSNIEKAIAGTESDLTAVTEKIAGLTKALATLDKDVADASEQRKQEHAYYLKLTQDDTAAKRLLDLAKNRLNKFYTPQLHTTSTTPFASREDQIYDAFDGASFAQVATMARRISSLSKAASATGAPDAPDAPGPYSKKAEESTGVIAMIDLLIKDLDTEITEAETDEKNDQQTYAALMKDSEKTKADDSKDLTESTVVKSELEAELQSQKKSQKETKSSSLDTAYYMAQLRSECDWLLQNFEVRTDARTSEMDALANAKAVLNGANYGL